MHDAAKLDHDTYKHMTTLSTGSLVLLVTFIDKLFDKPEWGFLVIIALTCFLISILFSVAAMFSVSYLLHVQILKDNNVEIPPSMTPGKMQIFIVWCSCGGFILGVFSLAIFAGKNFLMT